jgi:multidrug resistance efflux pump
VRSQYMAAVTDPWTRDGQVRAIVVQVAPRVSGPIVDLPIVNNQFVNAGDTLFSIDPRTFETSVARARADLASTGVDVDALAGQVGVAGATVEVARASIGEAEALIAQADAQVANMRSQFERQQEMLPTGATTRQAFDQANANYQTALAQKSAADVSFVQAEASLVEAEANLDEARANLGPAGTDNPRVQASAAALREAELNLEFTKIVAPVSGYITNLNLRRGSQVVTNQPQLALIDVSSFWVEAYFRENYLAGIEAGDRAIVTLMAYPEIPIDARVESIGWGIDNQTVGSPGKDLLPSPAPTFEWIRLAQRIPVRVVIDELPDGVELRVGTTASVQVITGGSD